MQTTCPSYSSSGLLSISKVLKCLMETQKIYDIYLKLAMVYLACERRRISGCRLPPPKTFRQRQATAENTSAFAGYGILQFLSFDWLTGNGI